MLLVPMLINSCVWWSTVGCPFISEVVALHWQAKIFLIVPKVLWDPQMDGALVVLDMISYCKCKIFLNIFFFFYLKGSQHLQGYLHCTMELIGCQMAFMDASTMSELIMSCRILRIYHSSH